LFATARVAGGYSDNVSETNGAASRSTDYYDERKTTCL
jgi:hypothetical protein